MDSEHTSPDPTLLLRADATTEIGTGHVMRCLALAQAWQAGGGSVVLVGRITPVLRERFAAEGIRVWDLNADVGGRGDAVETARRADEVDAPWIVVDGYHFGHKYQRRLRLEGARLLFIDDYGHAGRYEADLILNQNIDACASLYDDRAEHTDLLLGPEFALLRREFWPWRELRRTPREEAHRVLVTLGGADPNNLTKRVVQGLMQLEVEGVRVTVVVGGSNPHVEAVRAAAEEAGKPIEVRSDVTDMASLMAETDVAVSAGGSTCWELAFMGIPSVLIVLADNQFGIARGLDQRGIGINLGPSEEVSAGAIANHVRHLLESDEERLEMACAAQQLVDGCGADRVFQRLNHN